MGTCPGCGESLPATGLRFCPWCGLALAEGSTVRRKFVTIVFCDLVDSTPLGARLDPEVLRHVLGRYWAVAREAIQGHGGTVEKFIGDAAVGVFGIPKIHEDDALRAVRAAESIRLGVEQVNTELLPQLDVALAVRIGVHSGVVVGSASGETLMSGEAANLAARLEQAARPGQILISAATHELVSEGVTAVAVGDLLLKGIDAPVPAYSVEELTSSFERSSSFRRSAIILGREPELARATTALQESVARSCLVRLSIIGEAGVGKSRFVDELVRRAPQDSIVIQGRCPPYGEGITYWPIVQMLRSLEATNIGIVDWLADDPLAEAVLTALESITGPNEETSGESVSWAFRRLAKAVARQHPLIVIVDDLQWGSPALIGLLDALVEQAASSTVLLVAMARPEFASDRPEWADEAARQVTVRLAPLSESAAVEMVGALLRHDAPRDLCRQIAEAAEWVPLFIEELVSLLLRDGRLQLVADDWISATDLTAVDLPRSVTAILEARLDEADQQERRLLDVAAVMGQTFYPQAVSVLLSGELPPAQVQAILLGGSFVHPVDSDIPGVPALAFDHLLIAETAYAMMPKSRRASLHEAFAHWLEAATGADMAAQVVAFHLERAVILRDEVAEPSEALTSSLVQRLVVLADRSMALNDDAAAAETVARAARHVTQSGTLRGEILLLQSRILRWSGALDEALRLIEDASRLASALGDADLEWRAHVVRERHRFTTRADVDPAEVLALGHRAARHFTASGDEVGLAEARHLCGLALVAQGRFREARDEALLGLARDGASPLRSTVLVSLIDITAFHYAWGEGPVLEWRATLDDLEARFNHRAAQSPLGLSSTELLLASGSGTEAVQALEREIAVARDQQSLVWTASLLERLGSTQSWTGHDSSAISSLLEAADLFVRLGEPALASTPRAEAALALARTGQLELAAAAVERSRDETLGWDAFNHILLTTVDGLLAARSGRAAEAEAAFATAHVLSEDTEYLVLRGQAWLVHAQARLLLGDDDGGAEALARARERFTRKGFVPGLAHCDGLAAGIA